LKTYSRIALNTGVTYLRSILGVGLALFSSRWILQALGTTDFGLFSVVGSLIVLLSFFNYVMASSVTRHFAFAIGNETNDNVNRWFNTSLSIHLFLPLVLIAIGWPIAEYAIRHWLTIPQNRLEACVIVFRMSLVGAFVNMASIPFIAMFMAKQRIAELSLWGMLQVFMSFSLAGILNLTSYDRLLFYAVGMISINTLISLVQIARAIKLFSECALHLSSAFDAARLCELCHFAGWSLLEQAGHSLRGQGFTLLLNLYFGPTANAAFGIAKQVSSQTNQLANAMVISLGPEITSAEGRGDRKRMLWLAEKSSTFATLLVGLFAVPLISEMDYIVCFWLINPPEYTATFCRIILCTLLIGRLSVGYDLAIKAHGVIRGYQLTVMLAASLLAFPAGWLFLSRGLRPASISIAEMVCCILSVAGMLYWARRFFKISVFRWLLNVFFPCFLVLLISAGSALICQLMLEESFIRLVATVVACGTSTFMASWLIAIRKNEKDLLRAEFSRRWGLCQRKFYADSR